MSGLVDSMGRPIGGGPDQTMVLDQRLIMALIHNFYAGCALAGLLSNPEIATSNPQTITANAWVLADIMMLGKPEDVDTSAWVCKVCGCTNANPCLTKGEPCAWVEENLCSACVGVNTSPKRERSPHTDGVVK